MNTKAEVYGEPIYQPDYVKNLWPEWRDLTPLRPSSRPSSLESVQPNESPYRASTLPTLDGKQSTTAIDQANYGKVSASIFGDVPSEKRTSPQPGLSFVLPSHSDDYRAPTAQSLLTLHFSDKPAYKPADKLTLDGKQSTPAIDQANGEVSASIFGDVPSAVSQKRTSPQPGLSFVLCSHSDDYRTPTAQSLLTLHFSDEPAYMYKPARSLSLSTCYGYRTCPVSFNINQ